MHLKKALVILIFLTLLSPFITAQEAPGDLDTLQENLENAKETAEKAKETITNEDQRTAFLKQEWTKLLENTPLGPWLKAADSFLTELDPAFRVILGIGFTFSWLFILTTVIWLVLLALGLDIARAIEAHLNTNHSEIIKWALLAVWLVLISSIRIAKALATLIISFIAGRGHWAIQTISILVVIALLVALLKYRTNLKIAYEKLKTNKQVARNKEAIKDQEEPKGKTEKEENGDIEKEAEDQAREDLESE